MSPGQGGVNVTTAERTAASLDGGAKDGERPFTAETRPAPPCARSTTPTSRGRTA
jgi:hypothetical protein